MSMVTEVTVIRFGVFHEGIKRNCYFKFGLRISGVDLNTIL